jgi:hypothetical protein
VAGWLDALMPVPLADVLEREQAEREQLRELMNGGEQLTSNRSAGRIEDELWEAFLAKCKRRGVSNTDGMRMMIRAWTGMPEPAPLVQDAGSAVDRISRQ